VGYLYDCQHKHLPEFFERGEIERRDRAFAEMLERAPVVFANAQSVIADLRHWFPGSRSSLAALPFAALVDEAELAAAVRNAPAAHERYTAGRPYFIICNQFWAHKDHATAFRAFAKFGASPLRERWRLVCTGLTEDYRAPDYFAGLLALVDELGLRDRIVFTGFIDRSLQQSLLFGAAALVQPTLFEGGPGGGAAADAIALGVPCLLSDIDPNRELSSPLATFFRVRDADALASAMETIAANPPVRPSTGQILASSRCYERRLGEALFSLAERALAA
jgi:glycosyltransferase involved in cell wall biosynthesis